MSLRGITRYGGVRNPYLSRQDAKQEHSVSFEKLDGGLNLWYLD